MSFLHRRNAHEKLAAIIGEMLSCIFVAGCAGLRQAAQRAQYYYEVLQADSPLQLKSIDSGTGIFGNPR